ncbi:FAD-dependent oxidoreductase [Shinella sp. 838]|jgi:3-phenylpropionate/trans-cinnamate dioxygenase ferredoxin reductase subunit|uniref:NAD(P)/FAD-dependent oxidoreductase n=2 Tax=Shinella TaxID=323620 RepID=UPI00043799C8|nr:MULTISPECIES: FAD-dependent oxidoreductase [unclassified Shinella]EYR83549.1 anthranilate 1,2-dioxygenase system ferredoxin--NAD(+) reductase component [Shinella sp. DD12]MCA0344669.1 FAD-dependent oxidoreductase [Pseudomonadota bacterium]MDG4670011.1 FAD-dependent oxidoreductase [Shinella sp. 838]
MADFVIVGAGECGARAAFALREKGFDGTITLIGNEDHLPYERPPLSKEALVAGDGPKLVADAERYAAAGIAVLCGRPVIEIDRTARRVLLGDGTAVPYDKLLLATGARPRSLPGTVCGGRIAALRSHDDAARIRAYLVEGSHIAILGGGFIGLELATSARKLGASVTLIEGLPRILSRGVPAEIAAIVASRHAEEGVEVLCAAKVAGIEERPGEVRLTLEDGRVVAASLLVVGIGAVPNTELAGMAGLAVDNGIAVDGLLRTSDPDILAAGDCTSYPLPLYGDRRVRLESWRNAQEQGQLAAANMLGGGEAHSAVPWFWSDQYDMTLQIAGLADDAATTVRRDLGEGAFILFHLDAAGRLIAASGIGKGNAVARDIRLAEMLIAARRHPDPVALAAPETKLKTLLAA